MDSIISNDKKCYICGTPQNLHKHHIFAGNANRTLSDKYGLWVYLCAWHHNASDMSVHRNVSMNYSLRREAQRKFEETHTREEFIRIFTRSCL